MGIFNLRYTNDDWVIFFSDLNDETCFSKLKNESSLYDFLELVHLYKALKFVFSEFDVSDVNYDERSIKDILTKKGNLLLGIEKLLTQIKGKSNEIYLANQENNEKKNRTKLRKMFDKGDNDSLNQFLTQKNGLLYKIVTYFNLSLEEYGLKKCNITEKSYLFSDYDELKAKNFDIEHIVKNQVQLQRIVFLFFVLDYIVMVEGNVDYIYELPDIITKGKKLHVRISYADIVYSVLSNMCTQESREKFDWIDKVQTNYEKHFYKELVPIADDACYSKRYHDDINEELLEIKEFYKKSSLYDKICLKIKINEFLGTLKRYESLLDKQEEVLKKSKDLLDEMLNKINANSYNAYHDMIFFKITLEKENLIQFFTCSNCVVQDLDVISNLSQREKLIKFIERHFDEIKQYYEIIIKYQFDNIKGKKIISVCDLVVILKILLCETEWYENKNRHRLPLFKLNHGNVKKEHKSDKEMYYYILYFVVKCHYYFSLYYQLECNVNSSKNQYLLIKVKDSYIDVMKGINNAVKNILK